MALTGRLYSAAFSAVTIAAAQDVLAIYPGAGKIVGIQAVTLAQVTGTTVANFRLRLRYLPASVTAGSGGSTPTPRPWVSGDAAANATAHANDTTQATSGSTIEDLWDDVWNSINGFIWVPPIGSRPPVIGLSGAFVLSLDQAPASLVCNGSVVFEELP
jgi:hypothetical protein